MNLPETVIVREHVLYRKVEDAGGVILDLDRRSFLTLDETAAQIWEALTGTPGVEEAIEALAEEYEVDRTTLEEDVQRILDDLIEAGILEHPAS
jgi:hypothetical protein